jgi:SPX domain protein involved in polyphosphate accumulation
MSVTMDKSMFVNHLCKDVNKVFGYQFGIYSDFLNLFSVIDLAASYILHNYQSFWA